MPTTSKKTAGVTSASAEHRSVGLSSISQLLNQAWECVKSRWWPLLRVSLLVGGLDVLALIVFMASLFALGIGGEFGRVMTQDDPSSFVNFLTSKGPLLALLVVVLVIFTTVVSLAGQIASLLIVYEKDEKPRVRELLFKRSLPLVWPLFLMMLLAGILVAGGLFVFIIPGLIFGILFAFGAMELVLNGSGIVESLKRSMALITSHFGDLFLRWLVLIGINIVVAMVFGFLGESKNDSVAGIMGLLSIVVNVGLGLFNFAYSVELYRQAKSATSTTKMSSLKWVVVLAVIGWILAGWLGMTLSQWLRSDNARQLFEGMEQIEEQQSDPFQIEKEVEEFEQTGGLKDITFPNPG